MEVWWAKSFEAPLFDPMVGWTVRRFIEHLARLTWAVFHYSLQPFVQLVLLALAYLLILAVTLPVLLPVLILFILLLPYLLIFSLLGQRLTRRRVLVGVLVTALIMIYALFLALGTGSLVQNALAGGAFLSLGANLLARFVIERQQPDTQALAEGRAFAQVLQVSTRPEDLLGKDRPWDPRFYLYRGPALPFARFILRRLARSLRNVDERFLVQGIARTTSLAEKVRLSALLIILVVFHGLNALATIPVYLAGVLLILPLMFFVWVLSLVGGVPKIADLVNLIKKRLDAFLVGSLGDIKVFMDDPVQARRIRREAERALQEISGDPWFRSAEIYVVAHSTGAAVAYETLATGYQGTGQAKVEGLITVGSILQMVSSTTSSRKSFASGLPPDLRWLNIWTQYDPALAGPLSRNKRWRRRVIDIPVSNEGDPFTDHSAYWANDHQVIPTLVRAVWGKDVYDHFRLESSLRSLQRLKKRKYRILALSFPRLLAWSAFPLTVWGTLAFVSRLSAKPEGIFEVWASVWKWMARYSSYPVVGSVFLKPDGWWEQALTALTLGIVVTIAGQMVYKFIRAFLWDGFIRESRFFKA